MSKNFLQYWDIFSSGCYTYSYITQFSYIVNKVYDYRKTYIVFAVAKVTANILSCHYTFPHIIITLLLRTLNFRQHFRGFSFNQSRQTNMTCGDVKSKSPQWPCVSARACHTRAVIYVNYSCPDSRGAVLCAATDWTVVRSSCQLAQPTGESYGETTLPSETLALGNSWW